MAATEAIPTPPSGGIHIGSVGGELSFKALGDIVGGDKVVNITTTIQVSVEAVTQRPLITASPYRGLDRFEDRDKDLFFGRDQLIKRLLAQLSGSNALLVLGASGSGKSSVVRAGLLPALTSVMGRRFRYFTLVPDVNPFESLRGSLHTAGFSQTQTQEIASAKSGALLKLIHTLQQDGDQWLFFVDQFEEIFTLSEERLRKAFFAALLEVAQASAFSATKLVLAMRADFLDRFSPFPRFANLVEKNIDLVADMHTDELRLAIEQPAARHGVVLEQGLVEEIIKDVQGQAGSLPLLQYTLDQLWEEEGRQDSLSERHLRAQTYRELGGVRGALQKRADKIYASFGEAIDSKHASPRQEIVRQIFLRLVDIAGTEGNEAVWRPVRRRAVMTIFTTVQEKEVLQELIDQKLLVSNRENDAGATVEVAHEALFTSWERLKKWIESGKQVIFAKNRLCDDAGRWYRRRQQDVHGAEEELLGGSRLAQGLEMRARGDFVTVVGGLTLTEAQFLDASAAQREHRKREEEQRRQRELAQAQRLAGEQKKRADDQARSAARLRLSVVALALLVVTTALFWRSSRKAQTEAEYQEWKAHLQTAQSLYERSFEFTRNHWPEGAAACLLAALRTAPPSGIPSGTTASAHDLGWAAEAWTRLRYLDIKPQVTLEVHAEQVNSIVFSPDGQLALTASGGDDMVGSLDNTVRVLDAHTWKELRRFEGHKKAVQRIAVSPDGKLAISVSVGVTSGVSALLWEIDSLKVLHEFEGGGSALTGAGHLQSPALAFNADSSKVLVGTISWDVVTGKKVGEVGDAYNVSVSEDWSVVVATKRREIEVRNFKTGLLESHFTGHSYAVGCVVLSPDKKVALSGGYGLDDRDVDYSVRLWETQSGRELHRMEGHGAQVNGVAISRDGRWAASASADGSVRLWDIRTGEERRRYEPRQGSILTVAFSPDGKSLMCGSVKGTLCVWSTPSESIVDKKGYIVESVDISPDGQRAIVSGGSSGHAENIVLYDLNGLSILNSWSGHSDFVNHVILFPDGKKVISASWDKTVRIWNSIDGHELKRLEGPFNWESIALARDGGTVLTGANGYTRLWDCATGKLIRLFEGDYYVRSVAYSPDGKIAAGGCYYDGTVRIWDAGSGKEKERLRGHTGEVASVSFSFDSRLLATGTVVQENDSNNPSDGQVHIWDMADGKEIHRFGAGEGGINKLIFSPDGKTVLGASRNMVRVWDTTNGKELRRFVPLGDGPINSLACSTNGRVIVGSYTGEVAIFELIGSVLPKDPPSSQQAFEELDRLVGFRLMREGPDQGQIVSLKRLSEKEMLPITLATQGLNDKDVFVRIRSARELHRRGAYSEPALPQVQKALQDEDARVRLLCVGILGHLGPKAASAVFELAKRLNDTDYSIRCEAAKALGEIGERAVQVVPALAQALEEEEFVNDEHFARSLSRASAEALGRIGKPAAASVPALVQAFRSRKDDHFRSSYVRALGEIGEAARAAVPDLVEALMSDDVNLRQAVAIALVNMKCDASYRPRIEAALARETYTDVQLSLKQLLRSM